MKWIIRHSQSGYLYAGIDFDPRDLRLGICWLTDKEPGGYGSMRNGKTRYTLRVFLNPLPMVMLFLTWSWEK